MLHSYLLLQYRHLKEQGITNKPSIFPRNLQSDWDRHLFDVYVEAINTSLTLGCYLLKTPSFKLVICLGATFQIGLLYFQFLQFLEHNVKDSLRLHFRYFFIFKLTQKIRIYFYLYLAAPYLKQKPPSLRGGSGLIA
jgi:hypothetical protein